MADACLATGTLGVLELGTNSLKVHVYSRADDRLVTSRIEWEVGFEIYSCGHLLDPTIECIVEAVRQLSEQHGLRRGADLFGIATGAFRDAENTPELLDRLSERFDIPVRLLEPHEDAKLLAQAFAPHVRAFPAVLCDIGGGRTEVVFCRSPKNYLAETLELGVIKVQQLATFDKGELDEAVASRWIRAQLKESRPLSAPRLYATGGAVRAIAEVACTTRLDRLTLQQLESEVGSAGPPECLTPRRQMIFLAGLLVVRHLLEHHGVDHLECRPVAAGEVLMERLRPLYRNIGRDLLRHFMERGLAMI